MAEENEDFKIKAGNKYLLNVSCGNSTFEVAQVTGRIAFGRQSHDGYHNWENCWYYLEDLKGYIECEWSEEAQAEINASRVNETTKTVVNPKRKWDQ